LKSDVLFATDRLLVREYSDDDARFVLDMYSRWEVQQFLGPSPRTLQNIDEAAAFIHRRRALSQTDPSLGFWAVTLRTGQPIGTVVLEMAPSSAPEKPLPLSEDHEIGWHLHPDYWGHGYATEAAAGVLHRSFDAGIEKAIALIHHANDRSKRVANRLGMSHLGVTYRYYSVQAELYLAVRDPAGLAAAAVKLR
jgi:RimJ/RimL family protein N-acetyltransferase